MNRNYLCTLVLCIICVSKIFSQTALPPGIKTIIPPSPSVVALQKYGNIPVSPYTGVPDISIPLHTLKFHDITLPLSISYHASGIKVGEEASNVGLGWALNAGGVISRTIVGGDDFYSNTYFNTTSGAQDISDGYKPLVEIEYPLNYGVAATSTLAVVNPLGQTETRDLTSALQPGLQKVDFEPDLYNFNLPGLSGKFILKRNRTAVLEKQQNIDITVNATGDIWQIKSTDGFVYDFTQVENNHDLGSSVYRIDAVYLTKITSPTGHVVNLYYTVNTDNQIAPVSAYTQSQSVNVQNSVNVPFTVPSFGTVSQQSTGALYNSVRLNYIECDNQKIYFDFTNDRIDVNFDNKLNAVRVFTKNKQGVLSTAPLKTLNFGYDYFDGSIDSRYGSTDPTGIAPNYRLRLKLVSLTETGNYKGQVLANKPYKFTYYDGFSVSDPNKLPAKSSFARDHWGYYNGNINNSSLIPTYDNQVPTGTPYGYVGMIGNERDANGMYMQAFSLSDIQYPTGGKTHFDYEANECDEEKSLVNDNSVLPFKNTEIARPVYSVAWHYPDPQLPSFNALDANATIQHGTISYAVKLKAGGTSTSGVHLYLYRDTQNGTETAWDAIPNDDGQVHSGVLSKNDIPYGLSPGIYRFVVNVGGNTSVDLVEFRLTYKTKVSSVQTYTADNVGITNPTFSQAGGLRIKRIIDRDGVNPEQVKRYIYNYQEDRGAGLKTYSYGRRMSKPEYRYLQRSLMIYTLHIGDQTTHTPFQSEHLVRVSDSNIPLNGSAQGYVVGYDKVEVLEGEAGENGKSVYQYYNNPDVVSAYTWDGFPRQRPVNSNLSEQLNGSLLNQTDYRNSGVQFIPVKEVINQYADKPLKKNDVYGFTDVIPPNGEYDSDAGFLGYNYLPQTASSRLFSTYIILRSRQTYLSSTIERLFGQNNPLDVQQTTTNYFYDSNNHNFLTKQETFNSKAGKISSFISYPLDFTTLNTTEAISKGVANLKNKHVYNVPIETYTTKTSADGNTINTTSGTVTAFDNIKPLPATIYQLQSVTPVSGFTPLAINSTTTIKNGSYQPIASFSYDTYGNIIRQSRTNGPILGYQWGYNSELPVSEIKNAANDEFFFEGFEELAGATTGVAHTGNKFFTGAYTVSWTKPNARTYVISYWYRNTSGDWVFSNEQPYTASTYILSGGDAYDDVRIRPVDAQLTTLTFDPEVGITSTNDPKNLISTYEYNGLRRLVNIKNYQGDIDKHFEYHYTDESITPSVFFSVGMEKMLARSCTGGNVGSMVTYVVPPGKWTSAVSQAAADQLAMNDITNNAVNFANANSTCALPVYYSEAISKDFNKICSGSVINTVNYSIPFGKYTSNVSLSAANLTAKNDLDTNGQLMADNSMSCPTVYVTFTMRDLTGLGTYQAVFSGPNTLYFNMPAGNSTGQVPVGTYTVQVNAIGTQTKTFSLGGSVITGRTATFTNVVIQPGSSSLTLTIN
jgi:hypothetical protein